MKKITYSAPSVKKAFKILSAISDASNGLGISELAKQLKIGKSTVHGITSALEELGVLVRDPFHKKYTVGYTLLELGRRAHTRMKLRDIGQNSDGKIDGEGGGDGFSGDIKWRSHHHFGCGGIAS